MNLLLPLSIKNIFEVESFQLFANALSQGLIILDSNGNVVYANDFAQDICFSLKISSTPNLLYKDIIKPGYQSLVELIDETLIYTRDVHRQISDGDRIYVADSKPIFENNNFIGSVISLINITDLVQKEKQHEMLYQLSSALSRVNNLSQVLRIAIAQILRSVNLSAANIMLYDPITKKLKIEIDSNPDVNGQRREFKLGEGAAGRCAAELKPYSIYDVAHSEYFIQKQSSDHGALLVVPLVSKGMLVGVLNIMDDNPRFFTEVEVQFLTIIANEIAIAIENSRLYTKLNRRIKLLSKLYFVSAFVGVKHFDSKLQRMVNLIPELLDSDDCCLYLYAPHTNKLVLKYQKDVGHTLPLQIDIEKSSLSQEVISREELIAFNQDVECPQEFKKYRVNSVLAAPIFVNHKPIGILYVFNKHYNHFDEEDRHLVAIVAHRVGLKIENLQLLRKVESERELLDKIIRNTNEGVAVLNKNRKFIVWNRYLEELTGIKAEDVIGKACYKVLYNKLGLKQLTQNIYSAETTKTVGRAGTNIEELLRTERGDKIWVASLYSFILDGNKKPENTIILFRNISKDRELIEAKNEFISITTHELRTPLTAIKGYLSMVLKGDSGEVNERQRDFFLKAYNATERLVDLVEELLYAFRIDEERVVINTEKIVINTLIQEVVEELGAQAKAKHITLTFDNLQTLRIKADPIKTKQIISNLIDNAIKYTKERGSVWVKLEKRNGEAIISVHDTGVGIPAKYLPTIFDRFVRIHNPLSVKAGGAGLGLYIVKNLVEKQGGKIWVSSKVGRETTFSFTLPLAA